MDTETEIKKKVSSLIASENYIGAWLLLKEARIPSALKAELTGTVVSSVSAELNRAQRPSRDRQVYLRSILSWIFRDVPGLGVAYREQVRTSFGPSGLESLANGLRSIADVASGRRSLSEGAGEAAEDVRNRLEETGERIRQGEAGKVFEDVVQAAGDGLAAGLDMLGRAFSEAAREQGVPEGPGSASTGTTSADTSEDSGNGRKQAKSTKEETGRRIPVDGGHSRPDEAEDAEVVEDPET